MQDLVEQVKAMDRDRETYSTLLVCIRKEKLIRQWNNELMNRINTKRFV